jgi:hypothetical protein
MKDFNKKYENIFHEFQFSNLLTFDRFNIKIIIFFYIDYKLSLLYLAN